MTDTVRLRRLLDTLSIDDKVRLVSGRDFWSTVPMPQIGLRSIVLSDGPSGVRGPVWDERTPSLSLPSGSALAASWDTALAYRYGAVAAAEARAKGVDVVLGPTINLHRSPLGGRHFEAFSEDPLLSGDLAAAYVRGLQDNGVAATPKHYVANDSETDRFTVDVHVSERALRELYLLPFERAVEAGAWALMCSYNKVNGITMTENDLLSDPLNAEWGFNGVVVSDWTAVRSVNAALADIDLAMPGPTTGWSAGLASAVRDGSIDESVLDRKIMRLLVLADRIGALDGATQKVPAAIDGPAFAVEASIAGSVLLSNSGELPWHAGSISSIAVIGQHARLPRIQGGGSATVIPGEYLSPLEAVRTAFAHADVRYEPGAIVTEGVGEFPIENIANPRTGEPGVRVTFRDEHGSDLHTDDRRTSSFVFFDGDVPLAQSRTITIETVYSPESDGEVRLGFAASRPGRLLLDGQVALEGAGPNAGGDPALGLLAPPSVTTPFIGRAGVPIVVRAEFILSADDDLPGAASMTLGLAPVPEDPIVLIERAVSAARDAEVVIVVVGTNEAVESEGFDRESLGLPGFQDRLVHEVARVNPRTVVAVNAGSPVVLPWRDEVAAVLLGYFGGQGMGAAIAAIVTGAEEPGGRLTTTWPALESDLPVSQVTPTDGVLDYSEGLHIGYRGWLRGPHQPAYPFGWGLGYTTWSLEGAWTADSDVSDELLLGVAVRNTGIRAGKQVIQVYAERPDSAIERPIRWLVGSAVVRLDAGASEDVPVRIRSRAFSHWDECTGSWKQERGEFTLRIGTSVDDLPLSLTIDPSLAELNQ